MVIFNPHLAETAEKYLRKGSKVYVEGQLQTRRWTDTKGVERYVTEVVASRFKGELTLLDSQDSGPPPATRPDDYGSQRSSPGSGQAGGYDPPPGLDDQIPF